MVPTRTTVLLFVLALGLWLPGLALSLAPFVPEDAWVGIPHRAAQVSTVVVFAFFGTLFLLMLLDAVLAWRRSSPGVLIVRRDRPARLSVGVENEIALVVENQNRSRISLTLRDLSPAQFPARPETLEVRVPGRRTVRQVYRLLPTDRGNVDFGDIYLRCTGPIGLAAVDRKRPAGETVAVFPNLLEVRRYEALVRSTLVLSGGYRQQRRPGSGREFSHFRDYTPDDDYRHVNWRASARRTKPITSVYESEHSQDIIFCLDVGRMMATRVGALTKLDHAINAVLMLAHVSQTFQDNLGLLVFSHSVHLYLPPDKGRGQNARFLNALYSIQPELCAADYKTAFTHLVGRHPKRCLTMVFTDLLDDVVSQDYLNAVSLLKRFHLPLTLAVADVPLRNLAETEPSDVGSLYDVMVARDLLHTRVELLRRLERQGVPVLDTVPDRLTTDAVNRYLSLKTGVQL
jgi:uncharacterized protein (DUF58 family)